MVLKKISLTSWIVIGTVAGIIVGWIVGPEIGQIKFLGDIFIRLIQMGVVILVMGSVAQAVGNLTPKDLGRVGLKVVILFLITTSLAAAIGLLAANIFKPGIGITGIENLQASAQPPEASWIDLIVNLVPSNIIAAMAETQMIQAIVFAILLGLAMSILGEKSQRVLSLIADINQVLVKLIELVLYFAPIGVFALMAWVTGTIGIEVLIPLGKFLLVFLIATAVALSIIVGAVLLIGRLNPIMFFRKAVRMILVAVTTTSSAVTFPVQVKDSEELLGIGSKTSRLVYPLGMTINSDGLALYLSLATLTIAQFFGIELTFSQQITTVIMAVLMTIGTVVVPGGGLVAIAIVLPAVGLPVEGIALMAGIDWFSGVLRTLLNTLDDTACALYVAITENDFDRELFNTEINQVKEKRNTDEIKIRTEQPTEEY